MWWREDKSTYRMSMILFWWSSWFPLIVRVACFCIEWFPMLVFDSVPDLSGILVTCVIYNWKYTGLGWCSLHVVVWLSVLLYRLVEMVGHLGSMMSIWDETSIFVVRERPPDVHSRSFHSWASCCISVSSCCLDGWVISLKLFTRWAQSSTNPVI